MAGEKIRAFVALELGDELTAALARMMDELRALDPGVAWIKPANFHLTLKFLGDAVEASRLEPLKAELGAVAASARPFVAAARGVGGFPNLARTRVVWVGLEAPELSALAERFEAGAAAAGFAPERRRWAPHLTVGRVRDPRRWARGYCALQARAEHNFGSVRIDSMTLYRSILAPEGAVHHALATFSFSG